MKLAGKIAVNLLLFAVMLVCILPFWWMFVMATWENGSLFSTIPMIPGDQFMVNLTTLFQSLNIGQSFLNSCIVSFSSTAMNLFFSALAAYAFSVYRFKGKEILFMFIMVTMFVPGQLSFIGLVQEMKSFGLMNTLWPLILPSLGSALGIFVMRGYITESVSANIVDAARIDGCRDFAIFYKIVLPLILPVLASMGILLFMGSWNNYSSALVILYDAAKFTLPLAIATLNGLFNNNFSVTCMGILLSTLPIIIVYLCLSRFFIAALTSGAVKE